MGGIFSCLAPIPEEDRELENGNVIPRVCSPVPERNYNQLDVKKVSPVSDAVVKTDITTTQDTDSTDNDRSCKEKRMLEERGVDFESKIPTDLSPDMKSSDQRFVLADSKVKVRKKSSDNERFVTNSESPKCSPSLSIEDLLKNKNLNRVLQHNGEEAQEIVGGANFQHMDDSTETTVGDNIDGRHFQRNTLESEDEDIRNLMSCSVTEMCSSSLSVHSCTQVPREKPEVHVSQQDLGNSEFIDVNNPSIKTIGQSSICEIHSPLPTNSSSESTDKKSLSSVMVQESLFVPEVPKLNTLQDDLRGLLESTIKESLSCHAHIIRPESEITSAYSPGFTRENNLVAESTDTQNEVLDVEETQTDLFENPAKTSPLVINVQSATEATLSNDSTVGSEAENKNSSGLDNNGPDNLGSGIDKVDVTVSKSGSCDTHAIRPESEITSTYSPVFIRDNNLGSETTDKQNEVLSVEETQADLLEKPDQIRPFIINVQSATDAIISNDDTVGNEGENKRHTGLDNIGSDNRSGTDKADLTMRESLSRSTHSIRPENEITSDDNPVFIRENLVSESIDTKNKELETPSDLLEEPAKIKPLIINVQSTSESTISSDNTVGSEEENKKSTGLDNIGSDSLNPNLESSTDKVDLTVRKSSSCGTQTIRSRNDIRFAYTPGFTRETTVAPEPVDTHKEVFSLEEARSDLLEKPSKIKPLIINVQSATELTTPNDDTVGSVGESQSSSTTRLPVVR